MENPINILVVDDQALICDWLYTILTEQGFRVSTAGTVAEALTAIAKDAFRLAIIDVFLPNGTVDKILGHLPTETKVIVMSGHSAQDRQFRVMMKPFTADELIDRVRTALRLH